MNMEEEEFSPYGAYGSGCGVHGEDFLRECTMCGIEFCAACFPNSALCSDCAAQGDLDLEEEPATEEEKELLILDGLPDEETEEQPGKAIPASPTAAATTKAPTPTRPTLATSAAAAKAKKPAAKKAAPAKSRQSARPARCPAKPTAKTPTVPAVACKTKARPKAKKKR